MYLKSFTLRSVVGVFFLLINNGPINGQTVVEHATELQVVPATVTLPATLGPAIKAGSNAFSTPAGPEYTWINDYQTGIFHPALRTIGFSAGSFGETMRLYPNGNVGIGTLGVPTSEKLQIDKGNILVRGINNFTLNNTAFDPWGGDEAIVFLGDQNHFIKSKRGKGILISTYLWNMPQAGQAQFNECIYLQEGKGCVGIGTDLLSNPNFRYRLSVNGGIRAKFLMIETNWADFVFEKNYNLPPLDLVESYIKINGHLSEIPSANEVAENGVNVGEMTAKLLQKVEELTLYVIELRKEIDAIKKK